MLVAILLSGQSWHGIMLEHQRGGWAPGESAGGGFNAAAQVYIAGAVGRGLPCLVGRSLSPETGQRARAVMAVSALASWGHDGL